MGNNKSNIKNSMMLVMSFLALLIFSLQPNLVKAAPSTEDVFGDTPSGMNLKDYLEIPSTYQYSNLTNSAKIVPADGTDYKNQVDIIQMLDANGGDSQVGSFWGRVKENSDNKKSYNYFDLTKKQTISAWLYFGDDFRMALLW